MGGTKVRSWATTWEVLTGFPVCFCHHNTYPLNYLVYLLIYSYTVCLTLFRNPVIFVYHYILTISNNACHKVKYSVNIGLMNK